MGALSDKVPCFLHSADGGWVEVSLAAARAACGVVPFLMTLDPAAVERAARLVAVRDEFQRARAELSGRIDDARRMGARAEEIAAEALRMGLDAIRGARAESRTYAERALVDVRRGGRGGLSLEQMQQQGAVLRQTDRNQYDQLLGAYDALKRARADLDAATNGAAADKAAVAMFKAAKTMFMHGLYTAPFVIQVPDATTAAMDLIANWIDNMGAVPPYISGGDAAGPIGFDWFHGVGTFFDGVSLETLFSAAHAARYLQCQPLYEHCLRCIAMDMLAMDMPAETDDIVFQVRRQLIAYMRPRTTFTDTEAEALARFYEPPTTAPLPALE